MFLFVIYFASYFAEVLIDFVSNPLADSTADEKYWKNISLPGVVGSIKQDSSICDFPRNALAVQDFLPGWVLRLQFQLDCFSNPGPNYRLDFVQLDYNLNSSVFEGAVDISPKYSANYNVNKLIVNQGTPLVAVGDQRLLLNSNSENVATPITVSLSSLKLNAFIGDICAADLSSVAPATRKTEFPSQAKTFLVRDSNGSICLRADFDSGEITKFRQPSKLFKKRSFPGFFEKNDGITYDKTYFCHCTDVLYGFL